MDCLDRGVRILSLTSLEHDFFSESPKSTGRTTYIPDARFIVGVSCEPVPRLVESGHGRSGQRFPAYPRGGWICRDYAPPARALAMPASGHAR